MNKLLNWQLKDKMNLSLRDKVKLTRIKVIQFYERLKSKVYVSYSGGKDSEVLLDIVKSIYEDVIIVHVDEGLSYPEIKDHVKSKNDVIILRPEMNFIEVIKRYGYPVVSKEVAKNISRYRNTNSDDVRRYRKYGIRKDGSIGKMGVIPKKWHYLIDAPFKISDQCCYHLKIKPIKKFEKKHNLRSYIGIMVTDSLRRRNNYLKYGCNIFNVRREISRPLAFWTEKDIWRYIRKNKIDYCSIYDKGEHNTGCIYCLFGIHLEKVPNRIQRLYNLHPELYDYCINNLGLNKVLDFINVDYTPIESLNRWLE